MQDWIIGDEIIKDNSLDPEDDKGNEEKKINLRAIQKLNQAECGDRIWLKMVLRQREWPQRPGLHSWRCDAVTLAYGSTQSQEGCAERDHGSDFGYFESELSLTKKLLRC